jgi:hypothetical protein
MLRLQELNEAEDWGIEIQNAQIVLTEDNVELILTLMNNDRLASPINDEVYDVTVKKRVQ